MNIQKYWKNIRLSFWKFLVYYPLGECSENPILFILAPIHRNIIQKYWKTIYKNIEKNIPTQFLKISRVLPPRRILRKPGFIYISSDSAMICPEFGRILFIISIGTLIHKNIEKLYTIILKNYPDSVFENFSCTTP